MQHSVLISGDLHIAKWLLIYSKNVIIAQQVIMTLTSWLSSLLTYFMKQPTRLQY
jgi:hypothetical protein